MNTSPAAPSPDLPVDDLTTLALALVGTPSVSGDESRLADAVQAALAALPHLEVLREGNTIVARTHLGRSQRVLIAGHLDTVPVSLNTHNVPGRLTTDPDTGEEVIWGRGSVDMKGGDAVILHLAAELTSPRDDITWVLYDNEEVAAELNGLGKALAAHPDWFEADFAVLGEPTGAGIEGGCNGTLRLILTVPGVAAHSARAWRGANAIHAAAPLLERVAHAPVREVEVEGLTYRECFSVVGIRGGIATNSIPDSCTITVNYRFAPDLTAAHALARAWVILAGGDEPAIAAATPGDHPAIVTETGEVSVAVDDLCEAARPGLDSALAGELVALVRERGGTIGPKYGWTDVARFSAAGIPAVNLGPGDPMLCHTDEERCPTAQLAAVAGILRDWLA